MKQSVAVIVGSNRKDSINRKLAVAITKLKLDTLEFKFVDIDTLPMYNQDLEQKRPDAVNAFTDEMHKHSAVLIVTPEYNRSLPPVLKNAIDWGSKPADKNVWRDKAAVITGTTPGGIGTAVAQSHLRNILGILGATVLGGEAYVTFKPGMIDDASGAFENPDTEKFLQAYMDRFAVLAGKLAA